MNNEKPLQKHDLKKYLILSYSHDGIKEIETKIRSFSIPEHRYQIETIEGWAMNLCLFFPEKEYKIFDGINTLYKNAINILERIPVQKFIKDTYSSFHFDEIEYIPTMKYELIDGMKNIVPFHWKLMTGLKINKVKEKYCL